MKKLLILLFAFAATFTLAACSSSITDPKDSGATPLSSEESLATLSYLSAGFLQSTTPTVQSNVLFIDNHEETEIEGEMDDVNLYFDRLKAMMDNGVESFGNVVEEDSEDERFDYKITFTVNEETYVIHYTIDDTTGEMTGIIVIGDVEYEFEVIDNMREYKFGEQVKNENANQNQDDDDDDDEIDTEDEDDEVDTEDQEDDEVDTEDEEEENETKMMLIARNGEDTIKIMYKTETETDEDETEVTTKFDMEQTIDGVTKNIFMKISQEDDEYKIDIIDGESQYSFKREMEDEGMVYKLSYLVDGVSGTVKIIETTDENGETVYEYKVQEGGKHRSFERGRPDVPGVDHDEDDEDEEDTEEETTEA